MTVTLILPTLNFNFISRIKILFSFIWLWRPRSTVHSYLPSVLPVYLVSLLQQKLSYLLHKAIICLKAVCVIGIFESVETQWHFITVAHLLVKNVFLVSIILSQSLLCSVITGQCLAVLSVNQNLGTLRAPQRSWVQTSLQFTITRYIYLIVALDDSTESPTYCLLWQSVYFLALSELQGKMCKWNTLQKVAVLIKVLAFFCLSKFFSSCFDVFDVLLSVGFPIADPLGRLHSKVITSRMSVLVLCSSTTSMWFSPLALKSFHNSVLLLPSYLWLCLSCLWSATEVPSIICLFAFSSSSSLVCALNVL